MNTALDIEWKDFVNSPSRCDGISEHVERYLRSDTCKFIDEFGKKENLTGKMRLLACSLFHTFYLRVSFKRIPRWESAVGCLILAAKIENQVQMIKKMTQNAAEYLRPSLKKELFNKTKKQANAQFYHWVAQVHIRERQIIERLYGELRVSLPVKWLKLSELQQIINDKNGASLNRKSIHLSNLFKGCFNQLRKIFRCILCIYYPPPWIAAVALFKALRYYNKNRDQSKQEPKLYFTNNWFRTYDATNSLNLNILQYISDEVDACDETIISVKDYTTTPAEYYGAKDLALLKRINLVRTTKFNFLPIQIQSDLRRCFKLKNNQFIDLRSNQIKQLCLKNSELKKINNNESPIKESKTIKQSSPPNNNNSLNDPSTEWVIGIGPKQREIIKKLKKENYRLENLNKNQNLEEGEIQSDQDDDIDINKNHRKRKRKRSQFENNYYFNNNINNSNNSNNRAKNQFRTRNSNKNFQTKITKKKLKEDIFHCGLETYKYIKHNQDNNDNNNIDIDNDNYFMNWCIQRFEYDTNNQQCVNMLPKIKKMKVEREENKENKENKEDNYYRIPTPNYMVTGTTPIAAFDSGISPMTPGYGISPMGNGYGEATVIASQQSLTPQQMGLNDNDSINGENEPYWKRSYAQNSQLNDDINDLNDINDISPPPKKIKTT